MNQMTAAGNITFTYDWNGNTGSKTESQATTNYNWDCGNRVTKIDNPSGDDPSTTLGVVSLSNHYVYEYDGDGMRVRSGHDSGQGNVWDTRFYYDTGAPLYSYLFESDNDKTMTVAYTVDPYADLISQRRNSATYYHLYDQLGSTRKLLDSNQAVTDSYSYYGFGDVRTSSGSTSNPFKFVGQLGYYSDAATSLQYLRARYYAPAYGRFASPDPLGGAPYVYVGNRPAGASDPSGQFWPCIVLCVCIFGGLVCLPGCAPRKPQPQPGSCEQTLRALVAAASCGTLISTLDSIAKIAPDCAGIAVRDALHDLEQKAYECYIFGEISEGEMMQIEEKLRDLRGGR